MQNILFGTEYDEEKYDKVIDCCELGKDIKIFPGGQMTEIGERGINLSGGQKQRIALARYTLTKISSFVKRAIYQECDVYIMDDCLSAVDAHVGKSIVQNAIVGHLHKKTRLLATHQIQFSHYADKIIVMKDGRIAEMGTFDQLIHSTMGEFSALYKKYVKTENPKDEIPLNLGTSVNSTKTENNLTDDEDSDDSEEEEERKEKQHKLLTTEERNVGNVDLSVYKKYIKYSGSFPVYILLFIVYSFETFLRGILVFLNNSFVVASTDVWLGKWTQDGAGTSVSPEDAPHSTRYYLGIYISIGVAFAFFVLGRALLWVVITLKASKVLHSKMLKKGTLRTMGFTCSSVAKSHPIF